jgi:uncharacterized membrane protein YkoI
MLSIIRKAAITVAALAAVGLGAAAIAGAVDKNKSPNSGSSSQTRPDHPQREELSAADAAKVKAAALAKVPGATVEETEAGGPYDTPYHAHIRTSDDTEKVVLVDENFKATAVQDPMARGGRGPGGPGDHRGPDGHGGPGGWDHRGGPGAGESPLNGDKKQQVEDAVLAKYPGATIIRTETNAGPGAPYESHIETTDGKELEVLVSKDFEVTAANEHPAHP